MALSRLSLNALRAFEATARLRSFSAAANELSVTHGAVSRHIRMLEDSLGLPLLVRSAHGTEPTAEGQRMAERPGPRLRHLSVRPEEAALQHAQGAAVAPGARHRRPRDPRDRQRRRRAALDPARHAGAARS